MKKKVLLISLIIVLFFSLFGLYIYLHDNLRFKYEYEMYNNINFSNGKKIVVDIDENNNVKYLTGKEILNKLNSEDASVIYFGYPECPWCRSVISTLVDVVIENKINDFYYVDLNSIDETTVRQLKIRLDEYLEVNEEGIKTLYVPDVYFVKDGDIKYHHVANVKGYKDPFTKMNSEQVKELKNIYLEGINLIK